jgi:monoamine oxidase
MLERVRTKPKYYKRVTAIQEVAEDNNQAILVEINTSGGPNLSSSGVSTLKYSNVISTLPLSVLRTVDLDKVYLSLGQQCAFRELLYSPSVKVGIQFRTCWWQTLQIEGGQSYTDRPSRAIVYPSYGPGLDGSKFSNVLIASYNGMQDSQRLGAFIRGHGSAEEKILVDLVMKDLAVVHNKPIDELRDEYMDYFAWDWYGNTFSQGAPSSLRRESHVVKRRICVVWPW